MTAPGADMLRSRFLLIVPDDFNCKLSVVELPGGKLLFDPGIEDIAFNLGWINKPKHKEYDVSIFGETCRFMLLQKDCALF